MHAATVKVLNMPEQFGKDIRAETAMWARVIKQAGVKLD